MHSNLGQLPWFSCKLLRLVFKLIHFRQPKKIGLCQKAFHLRQWENLIRDQLTITHSTPSVFVNTTERNTATHIHLLSICGHFCAIAAERLVAMPTQWFEIVKYSASILFKETCWLLTSQVPVILNHHIWLKCLLKYHQSSVIHFRVNCLYILVLQRSHCVHSVCLWMELLGLWGTLENMDL